MIKTVISIKYRTITFRENFPIFITKNTDTCSNVTLIYKKGRKEDLGNCRSVSLTSVLGKLLQK